MKRTRTTLWKLLTGCVLFAFATCARAQGNYPITMQVQLVPPYSAYASDYLDQALISFTNNAQAPLDIYLRGRFENDRGQLIETNPGAYSLVPIHVPGMQTVVVQGMQLDDGFLDLNHLHTNLSDEDYNNFKRLGMLPEGYYSFCIYAYKRNANGDYTAVSDPQGPGACFFLNIGYVTPPVILVPAESDSITPSPMQNVNISWTMPLGNLAGALVAYDLYLVKVLPGTDPNVDMNNAVQYGAGLFIKQPNIQLTNFQFTNLYGFNLEEGSEYALMVQAKDLNNHTAFENNGKSATVVFRYGTVLGGGPGDGGPGGGVAGTPLVAQGSCSCAVDVAALDQGNNNSDVVAGGSFTMSTVTVHVGTVSNNGTTLSGDGTVRLNNVPVQVTFQNVVVNGDGVAIAGIATATTANGFGFLNNGGTPSVSTADYGTFTDRLANYNLDAVAAGAGLMLPFGLHSIGAPDAVNVGVVSLTVTPAQATYNAVAVVQLADANNVLSLAATNVCFTDGSLMCGDALFVLAENFEVPIIHLTFGRYLSVSEPGTFVRYSGGELQQFHIHADYAFPTSVITKTDGAQALAVLDADAASWSDWTASVTIDPFQLPVLPDMDFTLTGAALYDHSTLHNPAGMPATLGAGLEAKNAEIAAASWTGFFIPTVSVVLPGIVSSTANPDGKLLIGASNLVLDQYGLSGTVGALNVVAIGDGSVGGWYCSVDGIGINLLNSAFIGGGMHGQLILPFSDKNNAQSRIGYSCTLSSMANGGNLTYQFIAEQQNDVDFSAWWAHINLNNCSIEVTNNTGDGHSRASAAVSGKLSLKHEIQGYKLGLALMKVENLVLSTDEPYVHVDSFTASLSSPQHFVADFPITLSEVAPTVTGTNVGLQFTLGLKLSDVSNNILPSATATLAVTANVLGGERPVWQRMDLDLQEVCIDGDLAGVVHIQKGCVDFMKDDPKYGDGIRGHLKASFAGLESAVVDCHLMFGNNGFNYWYFDAYGTIPGAPPPIAPGIVLNGIGGGAYYNLVRTAQSHMNAEDYFANRDAYIMDAYVPSAGTFGMKVMVGISSRDGYLFNGIGELGADFSSGTFSLNGDALIQIFKLQGSDKLGVDHNAPVQAHLGWHLGISDAVFSVNGQVIIDYAGLIKGGGAFALLADAGNQNYFIKIGEPLPLPGPNGNGNRIHLRLTDPLGILNLKLKGYFMAGNHIDASIPPPDPSIVHVGELKGYRSLSYDANSGGAVFGASAGFDYDLRFAIFYFHAAGGIGFDLALLNGVTCDKGQSAGGLNGWYASGQVYAGLEGAFGLYVDVFFCHDCQVEALYLRADVLMQGGFPNPAWINGIAHTHYRIFDGLIEGNASFNIALGDKCEVNASAFDLPLIKEVKPYDGTTNVPINAYPEIVFNYPVEKAFDIILPGSGQPQGFKIQIDQLTVTNTDNGQVYADYRYSDSYPSFTDQHGQISLMPEAAFQPQTNYRIALKVRAMTRNSAGGTWVEYKENGQPIVGDSTSVFKTGYCKPDELISDSRTRLGVFPFPGQRYFLQGESPQGAIILDRDYSCTKDPNEDYKLFARFTPVANHQESQPLESPITKGAGHYLYFDIPSLPNDQIIRVDIVKRTRFSKYDGYQLYRGSTVASTQLARTLHTTGLSTVAVSSRFSAYNSIGTSAMNELTHQLVSNYGIRVHQTLALKDANLDVVLYSYHFKTSRFNTLGAKLASAQYDKYLVNFFNVPVTQIKVAERFDTYDVNGFASQHYSNGSVMYFTMPLVTLKETSNYNSWVRNVAVPLVYKPFHDLWINLDDARVANGLDYRQLQLEGIGCNYGGDIYCVPPRPVFLDGADGVLTPAEVKAAEPVLFHGINVSGMTVVGSVTNRYNNLLKP